MLTELIHWITEEIGSKADNDNDSNNNNNKNNSNKIPNNVAVIKI